MVQKYTFFPRMLVLLLVASVFTACASSQQTTNQNTKQAKDQQKQVVPLPKNLERPVPNSISYEIPHHYKQAVKNGTRTKNGEPGPDYWRQYSEYEIDVKIDPATKLLEGNSHITYHNNSPDTLKKIHLALTLNYQGGAATDVVNVESVSFNGKKMSTSQQQGSMAFFRRQSSKPGYLINGTTLVLTPDEPVLPGETINLQLEWSYKIPVFGGGGRMGYYNRDDFFYMAYWYPQIKVYDDVWGWHTVAFQPRTEFYHEFADYQVNISVPEQWIVNATGTLENASQLLQDDVYSRLQEAYKGTDVVRVVGPDDFGNVTTTDEDGYLTWNYNAHQVNDFAFSVTKNTIWDATTTPVGDRDGDGDTDYSNINAIFSPDTKLWDDAAKYAQHSIKFLSKFTGLPYPWPHMTVISSGSGGGMEYPMMTLLGGSSPASLYRVVAHELAHMWVPMQLAVNERRFAWMDEGTTTFNASQAMKAYPLAPDKKPEIDNFNAYLSIAGADREGPMMRWSQHFYMGGYTIASYYKPASVLVALRGLLGEETFMEAYRTFMNRWQYKHPYPADMFSTFEDISGRDLDWFWRSWYYTTWTLDQAVANVEETESGARIVIRDLGNIPMPTAVEITLKNGEIITKHIDVETWLHGLVESTFSINADSDVAKVVIDPEHKFPDANRSNNVWEI